MEQQPGPVNWAPYNPAPLPDMVRLWTWEAIAHGAEVVSYFRWRQAPFGQEQMHAGLQRSDGDWADGAAEAAEVAKEIAALGEDFETASSPIGLVFDYASAWAWDTQPQGKDFDYFRLVFDVYRGLRRLGLSVDILPSDTNNFGDRKLICIPGLFAWTPELKEAIKAFSGEILAGPRTGSKTTAFKIPKALPPEVPGLECKIIAVESLRTTAPVALEKGGHFHIWREFSESDLVPNEKTMDGHPALISDGSLSYVTGWPDDEAMTRLLTQLTIKASIEIQLMTGGQRRREIGGYVLHLDYDTGAIDLIHKNTNESLLSTEA